MNKSIALILSLLVTSVTVGCGSSDSGSAGASGSGGAGDSGGDTSSGAGADNTAAGDSSTGDTGNSSDAGSPGDTGGTSAGGGSSSGGSGDGAAGAPNPTNAECKKLEPCCVGLPAGNGGVGGPQGACEHIAGLNYGPSCMDTYSLYKCDGVIAMENQPKSSACKLDTQCTRTPYSAASDSVCSGAEMGVASENCPAEGVISCCKLSGVVELCYYDGNDSPISEDDCKAQNGTYSTTP